MDEMMNYIFGTLKNVERALYGQQKFNKSVVFFSTAVCVGYFVQELRIIQLEKEIKELKCSEGEEKCND